MRQDNPEDFFRRNNLPLKRRGNEGVSDCHVCGKENHLYINLKTFVWHCKRCDERGNEYQLKKALGLQYEVQDPNGADSETVAIERMTRELKSTTASTDVERWTTALVESKLASAARSYLESRKIPLSIAERYRLGWSSSPDGTIATEARPRRRIPGTEFDPEPDIGPGWLVIPTFPHGRRTDDRTRVRSLASSFGRSLQRRRPFVESLEESRLCSLRTGSTQRRRFSLSEENWTRSRSSLPDSRTSSQRRPERPVGAIAGTSVSNPATTS